MKHLSIISLLFFAFYVNAFAYEERNLLKQKLDVHKLESVLLSDQKWVKYPAYTDREEWNKLVGVNKENLIKEGDKYLKYE